MKDVSGEKCISRSTDAVGKLPCSGAATRTASSLVDIHWRNMPHDAQSMQPCGGSLPAGRPKEDLRGLRRASRNLLYQNGVHGWNRDKEEVVVVLGQGTVTESHVSIIFLLDRILAPNCSASTSVRYFMLHDAAPGSYTRRVSYLILASIRCQGLENMPRLRISRINKTKHRPTPHHSVDK